MIIILPAMILGAIFGFLPIGLIYAITVVFILAFCLGGLVFASTIRKGDGAGLVGAAIGLPMMIVPGVGLVVMWGVRLFIDNYEIVSTG